MKIMMKTMIMKMKTMIMKTMILEKIMMKAMMAMLAMKVKKKMEMGTTTPPARRYVLIHHIYVKMILLYCMR